MLVKLNGMAIYQRLAGGVIDPVVLANGPVDGPGRGKAA